MKLAAILKRKRWKKRREKHVGNCIKKKKKKKEEFVRGINMGFFKYLSILNCPIRFEDIFYTLYIYIYIF